MNGAWLTAFLMICYVCFAYALIAFPLCTSVHMHVILDTHHAVDPTRAQVSLSIRIYAAPYTTLTAVYTAPTLLIVEAGRPACNANNYAEI